jgi:putative chitinase
MVVLTAEDLRTITRAPLSVAAQWVDPLNVAMKFYEINNARRIAAFLGQLSHESNGFTLLEENLNYSAPRLVKVWPSRFPTLEVAEEYAYRPEKLANYVYANRMGNGDAESGDGWRFRGRGPIQLTGRANYTEASRAILGTDHLVEYPEQVNESRWAGAAISGWFWKKSGCNELADAGEHEKITRIVNGGLHGYRERVRNTELAMEYGKGHGWIA